MLAFMGPGPWELLILVAIVGGIIYVIVRATRKSEDQYGPPPVACPRCGCCNHVAATHCQNCGCELGPPPVACPQCGGWCHVTAAHCQNCGCELGNRPGNGSPPTV